MKYLHTYESLRDKMKPKSSEEIKSELDKSDNIDKSYRNAWEHIKNEIENKYPDAIFNKESTVYNTRYYITDRYDDEDNLKLIKKDIEKYNVPNTFSTYNGHSSVKVMVKRN